MKILFVCTGNCSRSPMAEAYFRHLTIQNKLEEVKLLLPNTKQQQLPIKEDLYPENTFIDIFDLLAEMQPNYNTALAYYNLSFYVSDLLTKNLTSQDAKLLHLTANRRRSESCINLLFDVYQSTKDSTIAIQAFAYAEKNKSTILKETISKKTLLQLHRNDSLLINEQSLLRKQERLTNSLIKEALKELS